MELSLILLKQVLIMTAMAMCTFLLVKTKVVKAEHGRVVSAIATNIVNPIVILNSFLIEYDSEKIYSLMILMIAAIVLQVSAIFVFRLLKKPLGFSNCERASIIYSNAGNLVIPLVQALFGTEAVFYCSAVIISQNFLLWSHGYMLVSGQKKIGIKDVILKPNIIAIMVGLVLFITQVKLPDVFTSFFSQISDANACVNMFAMGLILGGVSIKELFKTARNYLVISFRLIIWPLVIILLLAVTKVAGLITDGHKLFLIMALGMASPPAVAITNIAALYGTAEDAKRTSSLNSMGMILCIITMPLMVLIYEFICP